MGCLFSFHEGPSYKAYMHVALAYAKMGMHKEASDLRTQHEKYGYMLTPFAMKKSKATVEGNRWRAYEREKLEELKWVDDIVDDSSTAAAAALIGTRRAGQVMAAP